MVQANESVLSTTGKAAAVGVDGSGVDGTEVASHQSEHIFVDHVEEFQFKITIFGRLLQTRMGNMRVSIQLFQRGD